MALRGLWGSFFSRNRQRWRLAELFPPVRLAIGAAVAPESAAPALMQETVAGLQTNGSAETR